MKWLYLCFVVFPASFPLLSFFVLLCWRGLSISLLISAGSPSLDPLFVSLQIIIGRLWNFYVGEWMPPFSPNFSHYLCGNLPQLQPFHVLQKMGSLAPRFLPFCAGRLICFFPLYIYIYFFFVPVFFSCRFGLPSLRFHVDGHFFFWEVLLAANSLCFILFYLFFSFRGLSHAREPTEKGIRILILAVSDIVLLSPFWVSLDQIFHANSTFFAVCFFFLKERTTKVSKAPFFFFCFEWTFCNFTLDLLQVLFFFFWWSSCFGSLPDGEIVFFLASNFSLLLFLSNACICIHAKISPFPGIDTVDPFCSWQVNFFKMGDERMKRGCWKSERLPLFVCCWFSSCSAALITGKWLKG